MKLIEVNMKQETLTVLKNFASINKSIRIREGKQLMIFNPTIPLFAVATVEDEFPKSFSLYDLNQWLSTLSLFSEPNINFKEKHMEVSSGRIKAKYRYSPASITSDQPDYIPQMPPTKFSFFMPKEQLQEILKASSVMGLKELQLSREGLKLFTTDSKGEILDNEYDAAIEGLKVFDEDAKPAKVKVEALKLMPLDYEIEVNETAAIFRSTCGNYTYYSGLVVRS